MQLRRYEWSDSDDFLEHAYEEGWTDGLPVVPPTPVKVEAFLSSAGLAPDDVLGSVPTREIIVTAELAAVNAVMAGCRPEYFPLVVAAVRAHLDEHGNSHATTASLAGPAHALIINGQARRELGVACEAGCLGPGFRPNATIGRALRLVMRNVLRAVPGFLDRATFSWPLRYSFCFGENEEASNWTPLHVQRGLAPDQSAVTVQSVMRMVTVWDATSRTPEGIADTLVQHLRSYGVVEDRAFLGDGISVVLIMGKEHHRFFIEAGWSKEDLQAYMWPRVTEPTRSPNDRFVKIGEPANLMVVPAGGAGTSETWMLLPHYAWAITRPVESVGLSPPGGGG